MTQAAAAFELGPTGFVLKLSTGQELLEAVDHVSHGNTYITPKLRAGDWAATKDSARQFSRQLTQRQREMVQLLAEGLTIKQIAGLLNLSEKTVEFHQHHVMAAFNLRSNAAMVIFALKQGLISLKP